MVVSTVPVHFMPNVMHQVIDLVLGPTHNETAGDDDESLDCVSPGQLKPVHRCADALLLDFACLSLNADCVVVTFNDPRQVLHGCSLSPVSVHTFGQHEKDVPVAVDQDDEGDEELDADKNDSKCSFELLARPLVKQQTLAIHDLQRTSGFFSENIFESLDRPSFTCILSS